MRQKSKQKTFDHVVKHLLTQGEPSISGPDCLYRHENLMCAVGCLIDDKNYKRSLEGKTASAGSVLRAVERSGWSTKLDLCELQFIHDRCEPSTWRRHLMEFAAENGLKFNPPEGA